MNEDQLIHTTAIVALVLGRNDLNVSALRTRYGYAGLMAILDGLLLDLETAVLESGRYDVPLLVDGERLAGLLQVEIGSEIKSVTGHTAHRGTVQYLTAK